jgi:segregation and condensation protein B
MATAAPEAGPPGGAQGASPTLRSLSLPARLEAILYLKGRPLSLAELAELAGLEREATELALITLMADYAHRDTALEIHQEGQRYSLQLRDGLGDLVQNLLPVDLSTASLRTLATIALKKRILQSDLVELRGSGAYDHIKELLAQNFIERRRQSEGRSYWLSLTEKFHRTFAVQGPGLPVSGGRAVRAGGAAEQLELDADPAAGVDPEHPGEGAASSASEAPWAA